ncbi:hypothetical protein B5F14_08880 [Faecalitalea cylindroides]|uniref:Uncharacterized protein n=1 Tax=Faecalitalea cylindroides TaxID=39483 RepID=A0A1Y4LLK3_9FIRM|nr:hypothetical protein [Faecalitalea cylindroides]OUP57584.1 hypothetical protein B5F14_08880 [Faecalitalea cylindroides]
MENKNDTIILVQEDQNIVIKVNDETVITLNKSMNKLETKLIFDKLNICENYSFAFISGDTPKEKELEVIFKYVYKFLTDLKNEIDNIDYTKIGENS